MSKIGNNPIQFSSSVQVRTENDQVKIKGQGGEIDFYLPKVLKFIIEKDKIILKRTDEQKKTKSLHGLYRQLINNAIIGVEVPWQKKLEVVGTGYNVKLQGEDLVFKIGYSHPVIFKKQPNIRYEVQGSNKVVVLGPDRQLVGQVAHQIRMLKEPDPYKGKGIRYEGEYIKLKPGKKVKTTTTTA